jgi:transcriptional regulator with XRE-family HTH domain
MSVFSKRLKKARMFAGMSQSELGGHAGLDQTSISRYERGVDRPRIDSMASMCGVLGVSADWMLGIAGTDPESTNQDEDDHTDEAE